MSAAGARGFATPEQAFEDAGLTPDERTLVPALDWRGLIHYGVSFFMLEKLGADAASQRPSWESATTETAP